MERKIKGGSRVERTIEGRMKVRIGRKKRG